MALALSDLSICIVSSDDGRLIDRLKSHRATISSLAPHPTSKFIVSCASDATILWALFPAKRMRTVAADGRYSQAIFLHSGNTLLLLSKKLGVSLLHFPSLEQRARLLPAERNLGQPLSTSLSLQSIAVSPDGTFLFAATGGRRAYVWHLPSETLSAELTLPCPLAAFAAGTPAVHPVPAGESGDAEVAALGRDGVVRVLRLPDGPPS